MDWDAYARLYESYAVNIEFARQGFGHWHNLVPGFLETDDVSGAAHALWNAQTELWRFAWLRGLQLDLTKDYLQDLVPGELTDAQIFDACYRELVRRWT